MIRYFVLSVLAALVVGVMPNSAYAGKGCVLGVSDVLRIQVLDWGTTPKDLRLRAVSALSRELGSRLSERETAGNRELFSAQFNGELLKRQRRGGEFPLSAKSYSVRVSFVEKRESGIFLVPYGNYTVPAGKLVNVPFKREISRGKIIGVEFLDPVSSPPVSASMANLRLAVILPGEWAHNDCALNLWAIDRVTIGSQGQVLP